MSSSKFWQYERSCSCCQQTGLQEATFTLDCPSLDPPFRKVCSDESLSYHLSKILYSPTLFRFLFQLSPSPFMTVTQVKTYAPVDCICRACTDLGKENLQPQELIEALAGEVASIANSSKLQ